MSNLVKPSDGAPEPLLQTLLESALAQLRPILYALSDEAYPGLRSRHYRLLSFIPDSGVRVSAIADRSGLTKQALAQALALVRERGCVEVVPDPGDRRARLVVLTDRGRAALLAVRERTSQIEQQWAERIGTGRYAVARAVLTEIAEAGPAPSGSTAGASSGDASNPEPLTPKSRRNS
ncbi:MAG: MarR family protein [Pseudonocardiales bacterium]|nr:MarR family protein [Jatrophihabitantaceae bacterium]MCW2602554.1 MarR family protein [Pseudonocardiales bacterium]